MLVLLRAAAAVVGMVALLAASRRAAKKPVRYDPVVAARRYRTILSKPAGHSAHATVTAGGLVLG